MKKAHVTITITASAYREDAELDSIAVQRVRDELKRFIDATDAFDTVRMFVDDTHTHIGRFTECNEEDEEA